MTEMTGAERYVPTTVNLGTLRAASHGCHGCDLYQRATQTVFGEGPRHAKWMLVGEQPGDREDLEGVPFVGPAGQLLRDSLGTIGVDPESLYITNAVKHFKWEPRGKSRIHKKPSAREVEACKPWLLAEIDSVHPETVVCLGATAAQSLLGKGFRVTHQRGETLDGPSGIPTVATVHPSSILRIRDRDQRSAELARFIDDLRAALRPG